MSTTSIKISQLTSYPGNFTLSDYFPVDKNSDTTTYKGTLLQLQTLLSTGSFTGSFTGSLLGNLTGSSSWAVNSKTASYIAGINVSGSVISSSYALSASYVAGLGATLGGSGTTNYIPIWSSGTQLGNSDVYYSSISSSYIIDNKYLSVQNSSGQAFIFSRGTYNANLILQNYYTSSDAWTLSVGGDDSGATSRGVFELSAISSSNNFDDIDGITTTDPYGIIRTLRIRSNGFYFWPYQSVQSISKDGTVSIGLDTSDAVLNDHTRFLIYVYSGSSVANPEIKHLYKAIDVRYYSGSVNNSVFCVSSSGQVIANSYSGSNFSNLSFYGSASYALTSSISATASIANNLQSNIGSYAINSHGGSQIIDGNTYCMAELDLNATGSVTMSLQSGRTSTLYVNNAGFHTCSFSASINGTSATNKIYWPYGFVPNVTTASGVNNGKDVFTFVNINNIIFGSYIQQFS